MSSAQPTVAAAAADKRNKRANFQPMPGSNTPPHQVPPQAAKADPFYGHEPISRLCARFITHLFACPEYPPHSSHLQAKLPYFIAYALHRTKLHSSVTFAALVLLQRLKARFPSARGSSGHRLFVSAFMIASKVICDDTYSNKSWSIVAQGMFSLREINQMEREMCNYLDWELTVDNPILANFEKMINRDFAEDNAGSYPTYALQQFFRRAAIAAVSTSATPIPEPISPIPAFPGDKGRGSPGKDSPSKTSYPSSPMTPDTPDSTYSSTSPASTGSPTTPATSESFHHPPPEKYSQKSQQAAYDKLSAPPQPVQALTTGDLQWTTPRPLGKTEKPNTTLKSRMYAFALPVAW